MTEQDFKRLMKQNPYTITQRGVFKSVIALDEINLCDVPTNIVDNMVKLLNGAYKEGVLKSKAVCDPFATEEEMQVRINTK